MSVIGIVCEFNPFHKGHKYLIDSVKKEGDIVVCVMSGNFVQRAEPAIFPKNIRAKTAILNGADIILELPFVYATASAEIFAFNSVRILDSFGCDKLVFGTENADVKTLSHISDLMFTDEFDEKIKGYLNKGVSYPTARQNALNDYNLDYDISMPNNILALEYIKAIKKLNSKMQPVATKRVGAGYNDDFSIDNISSATHIRSCIYEKKSFMDFVPENLKEIYENALSKGLYLSNDKYNQSALTLLRSKIGENQIEIANMSEGLENRIENAVKTSNNLNEIYDSAKTKRYTHSRIRRAVLSEIFGIDKDVISIPAPYCRLLGFNTKASDIMGELAEKSYLPFITRYSQIESLNDEDINKVFGFENKSSDLYYLTLHKTGGCSIEMKYFPEKV